MKCRALILAVIFIVVLGVDFARCEEVSPPDSEGYSYYGEKIVPIADNIEAISKITFADYNDYFGSKCYYWKFSLTGKIIIKPNCDFISEYKVLEIDKYYIAMIVKDTNLPRKKGEYVTKNTYVPYYYQSYLMKSGSHVYLYVICSITEGFTPETYNDEVRLHDWWKNNNLYNIKNIRQPGESDIHKFLGFSALTHLGVWSTDK